MNIYQPTSETASPYPEGATTFYDFRKDFDDIARPAMIRYLKHLGYDPDEPSDGFDDCGDAASKYANTLWKSLRWAQECLHEGRSPSLHPGITTWSRERAVEFTNTRLEWILAPAVEEPEEPIDGYEAVYLGTQVAREQGYACEPEAIAYAADRLKSKIDRDAVENAEVCVHDGILTYYQWLKPKQERLGGGKVVYIDRHKQRREAREAERKQAEARFEQWFAEWQRAGRPSESEERADEAKREEQRRAPALPIITAAQLKTKDVGEPEFIVGGWIQNRRVGLLLGEDGGGKSFLLLMLAIAGATGGNWLGMPVRKGPVICFTGEEEDRDLKTRLRAIERLHGGNPWSTDLHLIPMAGYEAGAVLGELGEKSRKIEMTKLWDDLVRHIERINPRMVIIEPLNEVFDGDEMIRRQARQFVANLRILAIKRDIAVIIAGHPSATSVRERKPGAGSGGWGAIMRMRLWLEIVYDDFGGATEDRLLHRMKVTGAKNDRVPIELTTGAGGVLVLKDAPKVDAGDVKGGLNAVLAKIQRDKQEFMDAIEKKAAIGVFLSVSPKSPKGYASKALVDDEGGGRGRDRPARIRAKEQIMNDLLNEGRIVSEQYGPPSADKWRLKVVSRTIPDVSGEENMEDCEEGLISVLCPLLTYLC
jgi:hypothetical protein